MKKLFSLLCLVTFGFFSFAQTARVVGYLPTYRFSLSEQIEYCKLTHLNLAFANPDSAGHFSLAGLPEVMSDALEKNPTITICISLGGGGMSTLEKENWSRLIDIPSNRPGFISKIVNFVLKNNLDGVDMDLEWGDVTSGYSPFVLALDSALSTHNKILTAAFPNQTWFNNVSRAALEAFDFINIMSYDATGPWNPSSPGQHSSYTFSVNGINYWKSIVGIPGSQLTLGVPFYGYDFISSSEAYAFTYGSMVASNIANADLDRVGDKYYNGRPTIESKVELAYEKVSGIMIWELGQDSFDDYSLLSVIHNKYTSLGAYTSGLCGNENTSSVSLPGFTQNHFEIFPNPASGYIKIKGKNTDFVRIRISDVCGQIFKIEEKGNSGDEIQIDISFLPSGLYFIILEDAGLTYPPQKLVVF